MTDDLISRLPFTIPALQEAYAQGLRPPEVIAEVFARIEAAADPGIFLHLDRHAAIATAEALGTPDGRPLWGIPFAVKDNIDVAGMPTTAACPDYAFQPEADAVAVARLRAAGAIVVGKTNLDQFATGLVGTRTPHPVPRNAIDPEIVPGGSSSGSAVAVARGIVTFALGTDTAGSGRVPGALNSVVGLKPSLGAWSTRGVVPACRTLDTISVFALTVEDAWAVHRVAAAYDPQDAFSRPVPAPALPALPSQYTVAVPDKASLQVFGDTAQSDSFAATLDLLRSEGARIREIDLAPFYATALMLYERSWVAERVAAVGNRLSDAPETIHSVVRRILASGTNLTAVDAFRDRYRLAELRRQCETLLDGTALLCVPTIPTFVTLAEDAADPVGYNARLGTYTNFVNLLDMCGIAVPCGTRSDGRPASVTLLGRSGDDAQAASLAQRIEAGAMGATGWERPDPRRVEGLLHSDEIGFVVCGAHMSGLPLNHELTSRCARYLGTTKTAREYRLFALPDGRRAGIVRMEGGAAIEVELWALPLTAIGGFLENVSEPLCAGTIRLADGSQAKGFLCETSGIEDAADITEHGGWRAYLLAAETRLAV